MNRQQRRDLTSRLYWEGLSNGDIQTIIKFTEAQEAEKASRIGDKVKLNLNRIMQHPGWEDRRPEYREFCKNNANRTFTVEDDKYHKGLVCLAEDRTVPKWLFWPGDLKKVSDE